MRPAPVSTSADAPVYDAEASGLADTRPPKPSAIAQMIRLNTSAAVQPILRAKPTSTATAISVSATATRDAQNNGWGDCRSTQKLNHPSSQPARPSLPSLRWSM